MLRAAAYVPRYSDGRQRVGGFDEDAFTFLAAALERAEPPDVPAGGDASLTPLGAAFPAAASDLAELLGAPVRLLAPPTGHAPLAEALEQAAGARGPAWIAIISAGAGEGKRGANARGDGAAALLVDDGEGLDIGALARDARSNGAGDLLGEIVSLLAGRPGPSVRTGDWEASPSTGPSPPGHRPTDPPTFSVSQGAFVPQPRYEESRPSRWRFVGERCGACQQRTFPARGRCRSCGRSDALRAEPLPLRGAKVLASTWIGAGGQPTEFDEQVASQGPYGVVVAELAPDARVTLAVTDARPDEMRVGATIDTELRRLYPIEGGWRYGRKAVPPRP